MDFDLNDDQRLIKESLGKLLNSRYGDFARRDGYIKQQDGFDRAVWADYSEAGILALPLPEAYGGFGGGPVERMIVLEELGAALAVEPYLTAIVLCGGLVARGDPPQQRREVDSVGIGGRGHGRGGVGVMAAT